jgi:hypothetical protein
MIVLANSTAEPLPQSPFNYSGGRRDASENSQLFKNGLAGITSSATTTFATTIDTLCCQ